MRLSGSRARSLFGSFHLWRSPCWPCGEPHSRRMAVCCLRIPPLGFPAALASCTRDHARPGQSGTTVSNCLAAEAHPRKLRPRVHGPNNNGTGTKKKNVSPTLLAALSSTIGSEPAGGRWLARVCRTRAAIKGTHDYVSTIF